jgi:hypothetical protein
VHRSGTDPYNHEDPFVWDIEHWQYGGPHGSTGYDKNYQIDSRLNDEYYPVDYLTLEISSLGYNPFWRHNHLSLYAVDLANAEAEEIIDIIPVENDFRVIDWCRSGAEFSLLCFCGDYFIMHYAEGEFEQIALSGLSEGYDQIEMINGQWLVKSANNLVLLNEEGELEEVFDPGETELQDFSGGEENLHYIFNLITLDYTIYSENEPGELVELTNYDILNFDPDLLNPDNSSLESYYQETTMVMQLLLKFPSEEELPDFYGSIYLASDEVDLEVVKTQEDQLVEAIEYGIYPNPFNAETTISFCLPEPQKVEISVYNLKGQKVAELAEENYEAGDHQLEWKAENCSSGIYLVEYRFDDKLEKQAKVTLLK